MERATGSGAPAPLTQQEQELRDLDRQGVPVSTSTYNTTSRSALTKWPTVAQVGADINVATKHELIHAVSFPLTEDARLAIERFKQYAHTRVNYVQLVPTLLKLFNFF